MKNYLLLLFLLTAFLLSTLSMANSVSDSFDTRPVLPTIDTMRNSTWTWENFTNLPNMTELKHDNQNNTLFSITQTIHSENPQTTITFYGTEERPEVAVIESRTWGAGNTQASRFVRLDKIRGTLPLQSNCNLQEVSISDKNEDDDGFSYETGATLDFQKAYVFPKDMSTLPNAKSDLYVASSQVDSYVITGSYQTQSYTKSIITPNQNKLGDFINQYGWNIDNNGNELDCFVN